MAKTYSDIQKQIEDLRKTAESLRQKEVAGVIDRIKIAIQTYQLTAEDLGLAARAAQARSAKGRKATRTTRAALYRDAEGNTWSGRGRRPAWLNAALAAGKTLDDLRA